MSTRLSSPGRRPPPVPSRPAVDPRLHQRWVETRRQQGRRRLHLVAGLGGVAALVLAALGALHSPLLRVRHVVITGVAASGLQPISAAAGFDRQKLMIDVDASATAAAVERLPWVDRAAVVRRWPSTLQVTVTQRTPVGEVARIPGHPAAGAALVDRTGRVLALRTGVAGDNRPANTVVPMLVLQAQPGAPGTWLAGTAHDPSPGPAVDDGTVTEILAVAAAIPPSMKDRVSSVAVVAGQLQVLIGSVTVDLGSALDLEAKMASLQTIVADVPLSGVRSIDLRVPDRPALTPVGSSTSLSTTSGG